MAMKWCLRFIYCTENCSESIVHGFDTTVGQVYEGIGRIYQRYEEYLGRLAVRYKYLEFLPEIMKEFGSS